MARFDRFNRPGRLSLVGGLGVALFSGSVEANEGEAGGELEGGAGLEFANCQQLESIDSFLTSVGTAQQAVAELDREGLVSGFLQARQKLPCVGGELSKRAVASYHRLGAMVSFVEGDREMALRLFSRARELQPGYALPTRVAPSGHPLALLYEEAAGFDQGEVQEGTPPPGGHLNVDGVPNGSRPIAVESFVQVWGGDGELMRSIYVPAGVDLPDYGGFGAGGHSEVAAGPGRPMLMAGGGALLGSAALFALATIERSRFDSDEWLQEQAAAADGDFSSEELLGEKAGFINTLSYSSAGLAVLGAGLGVTAVVVW